jgi:mannose-6-phosphate isomerase-like protein (cupin superfamily)
MPHDDPVLHEPDRYVRPGEPGHNTAGGEVVWERWQKKRTFVRALEGTYGELVRELFTQPRVYHAKDWKWKGGPQLYGKTVIHPGSVKIAQSIECHLNTFSPHGAGQKHGHMNSAVFFILKGHGHDVHDGRTLPFEAGDACIVETGCVHQHFNDGDDEMMVLVMKAKPLFLFMHLMFQKMVEYPPKVPSEGGENYTPPTEI